MEDFELLNISDEGIKISAKKTACPHYDWCINDKASGCEETDWCWTDNTAFPSETEIV